MTQRTVQSPTQTDTANNAADAVSVGTSSGTLVAANPSRVAVYIVNDHASQIVYLALGATATANKGIRLSAAGGSVVISSYTGAISAIASGAATTVVFSEV